MYINSQDVCAGKRFPREGIQVRKRATSRRPSFSFSLQHYSVGLSCMLQPGCDLGLIEGVSIGQAGLALSHLQFADDTLIFISSSLESMQNVKRILLCFELMSGLKVNFSESSIFGMGVEDHVCDYTTQTLRCKQGNLPFKYIGLPVGANSYRSLMWNPIIHNISSRLAAWKGKLLSIGGRLCLIKSVLNNLPIYFLSLFPIPVAVATKIKKKFRCFCGSKKRKASLYAMLAS